MRAAVFGLTFVLCVLGGFTLRSQGVSAGFAWAQEESQPLQQGRATQFVGVEGANTEQIAGGPLLIVAYALVWLFLFGYLMRLRRLQKQMDEELARLHSELQRSEE